MNHVFTVTQRDVFDIDSESEMKLKQLNRIFNKFLEITNKILKTYSKKIESHVKFTLPMKKHVFSNANLGKDELKWYHENREYLELKWLNLLSYNSVFTSSTALIYNFLSFYKRADSKGLRVVSSLLEDSEVEKTVNVVINLMKNVNFSKRSFSMFRNCLMLFLLEVVIDGSVDLNIDRFRIAEVVMDVLDKNARSTITFYASGFR